MNCTTAYSNCERKAENLPKVRFINSHDAAEAKEVIKKEGGRKLGAHADRVLRHIEIVMLRDL